MLEAAGHSTGGTLSEERGLPAVRIRWHVVLVPVVDPLPARRNQVLDRLEQLRHAVPSMTVSAATCWDRIPRPTRRPHRRLDASALARLISYGILRMGVACHPGGSDPRREEPGPQSSESGLASAASLRSNSRNGSMLASSVAIPCLRRSRVSAPLLFIYPAALKTDLSL